MKCRHCSEDLTHTFVDLGLAPPSNNYLEKKDLDREELKFPLKTFVCKKCWLVQTIDYEDVHQLFKSNYAYFSSTSKSFLKHAATYVEDVIHRFNLNKESFVVEIASNDGYLLRNFIEKDIPCLGIEPTESTANHAEKIGIQVLKEFFSSRLAKEMQLKADLIIGNNVFAHVPDINDFSIGMKEILNDHGVITLEFPHLLELVKNNQFDTIYHEHFSYLSLFSTQKILEKADLKIFDVRKLGTHGGSLRVYACHEDDNRSISDSVLEILLEEKDINMQSLDFYLNFQAKAEKIKADFCDFLIKAKKENKRVAAYGAAAKGNTLLNFSGIKNDMIEFVCDAAKSKQGMYLPGSHIPVVSPKILEEIDYLDYLIIFPWNIADEIISQTKLNTSLKVKYAVFIPSLKIF